MFDAVASGADDMMVAAMPSDREIDVGVARNEIRQAREHQGHAAVRGAVQPLRKLESLLAVKHALANADPRTAVVERRARLPRTDFLHDYYALNRPVILTGMLKGSAAFERWSPDYLKEACGSVTVEVMSGRNANPRYEIESEAHRVRMQFSTYIERIEKGGASNDLYLVANNGFFDLPGIAVLRDEVPLFPEYLVAERSSSKVFLWFGPAGTVTPLHHDVMNVLVAQIRGRKRFTLISPDQTPWLYNHVGVYSEVDCEKPDLVRFPLFRKVRKIFVDLLPGEVLFIPVGWWHHVRAIDPSIMITYTNFAFPNEFQWDNPV